MRKVPEDVTATGVIASLIVCIGTPQESNGNGFNSILTRTPSIAHDRLSGTRLPVVFTVLSVLTQ